MVPITEDYIKRASLRFLKNHYKFHPRVGPTTAQFDMKGENGVIADGHLHFLLEDGNQFLATFEATSENVFDEVKYKQENNVLFFDSLAAGFITASCAFLYGFLWQKFTIKEVGWVMTLSIVCLAGIVGFFAYRYLVKNRKRYRYIYAIEQFKRYHADDQWIAISDRIFPNSENIYFEELKRQCIDFGIGLVKVSENENVKLIVAPARQDEFGNSRKMANFAAQNLKLGSVITRRVSDQGRKLLDRLFGKSKNKNSLQRYRRSSYKQIITCILSTVFMSFLFVKEWNDQPIEYANKSKFEKAVTEKLENGDMETLEYLLDTAAAVEEGRYKSSYIDVPILSDLPPLPTQNAGIETWNIDLDAKDGGSVYLNAEGSDYTSYDCERLFNFEGELYLVRYQLLASFESAKKKVGQLEEQGLEASILWLGCFEDLEMEYALYFDLLFPEQKEALKTLAIYQQKLKLAGFKTDQLKLIRITK